MQCGCKNEHYHTIGWRTRKSPILQFKLFTVSLSFLENWSSFWHRRQYHIDHILCVCLRFSATSLDSNRILTISKIKFTTVFYHFLYVSKYEILIEFLRNIIRNYNEIYSVIAFRCFLLLLLLAAVLWKIKQKYDMYRRRQRLFVEMEQMASRPFSEVFNLFLSWSVHSFIIKYMFEP